MNRSQRVAALLVILGSAAGSAYAQAPTKAAQAQQLAKLKAQRDALLAQKAQAKGTGGAAATTTTPTPTNTTILRPPPNPNPVVTNPTPTGAGGTTGAGGAAATSRPTTTGGAGGAAATGAGGAGGTSATKTGGNGGAGGTAAVLPPKDRTDTAAIALDLEALKKSRPDRRHAEIVDLKARFGNGLLRNDRVLAELKQHAQRIAYLQRIRALSVKANDAKTVKEVDELLTKEELRSANAVNELRSGAIPAVAATPPAAAPGGAK